MPGTRTPIVRVVALVALLILLGTALRGRIPGVTPRDPERPTDGWPPCSASSPWC